MGEKLDMTPAEVRTYYVSYFQRIACFYDCFRSTSKDLWDILQLTSHIGGCKNQLQDHGELSLLLTNVLVLSVNAFQCNTVNEFEVGLH